MEDWSSFNDTNVSMETIKAFYPDWGGESPPTHDQLQLMQTVWDARFMEALIAGMYSD